jgi:hypothetical protein
MCEVITSTACSAARIPTPFLSAAFVASGLVHGAVCASSRPRVPRTYHLLEQQRVAFSKKHTEVQDFWDVKEEVIVEDLSKCRGGDEVILRKVQRERMETLNAHKL